MSYSPAPLPPARCIFITADCWTSRSSNGFVTVEITINYFDPDSGTWEIRHYHLGCVYLHGSHSGVRIAKLIKDLLEKHGIHVDELLLYISDCGGGIPAAAKTLKVKFKSPCTLHVLDTTVGHALGIKAGRMNPTSSDQIKTEVVDKAKATVNVFKNATLRLEKMGEVRAADPTKLQSNKEIKLN